MVTLSTNGPFFWAGIGYGQWPNIYIYINYHYCYHISVIIITTVIIICFKRIVVSKQPMIMIARSLIYICLDELCCDLTRWRHWIDRSKDAMEYQQHGCLFSSLLQKVHGAVQTEVTDRCFPGAKLRVLVPVDLAGNWKFTIFERTIPYKWVCKIGYSQIQWFIYIGLYGVFI